MQTVPLVITAIVGLFVGYLVAHLKQRKRIEDLEDGLRDAEEETSYYKRELTSRLEEERAATLRAERELVKVKKEADQLKEKLSEADQTRSTEEKKQEASYKASLQDAEERFQQAQTLAAETQQTVTELEEELARVIAERDDALARQATSGGSDPAAAATLFEGTDGSLEGVLGVLLEHEQQEVAVLSDANGIIVAAAGSGDLREGIAAAAPLVGRVGSQFGGMVPLGLVTAFQLQDEGSNVLSGRSFQCAGETVGLTTFGNRPPASAVLDGAAVQLSALLS